jgi:hypothetical protein
MWGPQRQIPTYHPVPPNFFHIENDRVRLDNRMMHDQLQTSFRENFHLRQALLMEQLRNSVHNARVRSVQKRKRQDEVVDIKIDTTKQQEVVEMHMDQPTVQEGPPPQLMNEQQVEEALATVFGTLFTLQDILDLADHPDCRSLATNPKFAKLLNIAEPVRALQNLVGLTSIKAKAFDILL